MSADQRELRGLADSDLVSALDAIAMAKGLSRNDYVNKVLGAHVASYFDELRLVQKICRDNPLLAEDAGKV